MLEKTQIDNLSSIAKAHDDGMAEGIIKGRTEGKEEGIAEGLEKGKKEGLTEGEHNAKIETARNLLKMGLQIEQISKATGLTIEEVKELV